MHLFRITKLVCVAVYGISAMLTSPSFASSASVNFAPLIAPMLRNQSHSYLSVLNAFQTMGKSPTQVQQEVETEIKSCMAKYGFVYWPISTSLFTGWDVSTFWKFRSTSGYGIAPKPTQDQVVKPGAAQLRYLRALPPTASRKYFENLFGSTSNASENIEGDDLVLPSKASTGCSAKARRDVLENLPIANLREHQSVSAFEQSVLASNGLKMAETHWSSCMAGFKVPAIQYDSVSAKYLSPKMSLTKSRTKQWYAKELYDAKADSICYLKNIVPSQTAAEVTFGNKTFHQGSTLGKLWQQFLTQERSHLFLVAQAPSAHQ